MSIEEIRKILERYINTSSFTDTEVLKLYENEMTKRDSILRYAILERG